MVEMLGQDSLYKYPGIPMYFPPSREHPGVKMLRQASLSKYPGIPMYLPPSRHHPWMVEMLGQASLHR